MNTFVEECRREWKRLRVPDSIADEMTAELTADLEEAQADGIPVEEVLGSAVTDPRSFAAAWAAERGAPPSRRRDGVATRAVVSAVIAALAAVAVGGAILMIVASDSTSATRQALAPRTAPKANAIWATQQANSAWVAARTGGRVTIPPPPVWVEQGTSSSGVDTRTVGLVLLMVGIAGMVPVILWSLWASRAQRLRTVS